MRNDQEDRTVSAPVVRKASSCLERAGEAAATHHRAAHAESVNYRLPEATNGQVRAIGTVPDYCRDRGDMISPWHKHDCDIQFTVVIEGSVELGLVEGTSFRVGAGEILCIPGFVPHQVSEPSADYVCTEITFPGAFATLDAEAPATSGGARIISVSDGLRAGIDRGVISYEHALPESQAQSYRLRRERRSRVEPFAPGPIGSGEAMSVILVIQGGRSVDVDGTQSMLEPGDILLLPRGAECRDVAMSDDYEGLRFSRIG